MQALFARLQQLASVVGDVLSGKEKLQKNLLARLIETVVIWLSDEQEFWDVFEDKSACLLPCGLQQVCYISCSRFCFHDFCCVNEADYNLSSPM